jgi:hypothetical protein
MALAASNPISPRLLAAWCGFCILMVLVGLQERWYAGEARLAQLTQQMQPHFLRLRS